MAKYIRRKPVCQLHNDLAGISALFRYYRSGKFCEVALVGNDQWNSGLLWVNMVYWYWLCVDSFWAYLCSGMSHWNVSVRLVRLVHCYIPLYQTH